MLHYPGGITDEQWARFLTYNAMCKSLFYDFWRTEEITLKAFFAEMATRQADRRAELEAELEDDPDYNAFLERADREYDERRLS